MNSSLHGLDWIAMALSLLALYLIGNRNRWGFVAFMGANLSWLGVAASIGSPAIALGNLAFFGINLRGYFRWRSEPLSPPQPHPPSSAGSPAGAPAAAR
jgi:hypothetical protein